MAKAKRNSNDMARKKAWWDRLSVEQKKESLRKHPNSKFATGKKQLTKDFTLGKGDRRRIASRTEFSRSQTETARRNKLGNRKPNKTRSRQLKDYTRVKSQFKKGKGSWKSALGYGARSIGRSIKGLLTGQRNYRF